MKLGPHWLRERRFWRPRAERDVDDELAFHLSMRAELLESSGLDPQSARDAALHRFGDVGDVREQCITISHERERRMKRLEIWTSLGQHARYAIRRLRATPGFAVAVIALLSLGIGATTAVFGVVDGILLRPLPFPQPERLVALTHSIAISGISQIDQSDATVMLYQRHATRTFSGIGAYRMRDVNLGEPGDRTAMAERVSAAEVTASLFPTLGVVPSRGRAFSAADDRPGAPPVVIISGALWRRKFAGDPNVIGRSVALDAASCEVIGVMPDDFRYPGSATAVWYPLRFDPAKANVASFNFKGVGRLREGVSPSAATVELAQYLPRLFDEFATDIPRAMFEQAHLKPQVQSLRDVTVGNVGDLLWILFGAVGLLLVIACANVASLFLVRAEGAQRDIAIRMALGAGRSAVVIQYLAESMVLAVGGGAVGILLAVLGVRALRAAPGGADLPRLAEVGVDGRIVLFAIVVTALCAVAVSLLPVLRARDVAPGVVLKESSRSATVGRERQRARSVLVVAQVALALVLVAGSTLMARSFRQLRNVHPGFEAANVLTLRVAPPNATYPDAATRSRFYERVLEQTKALPGVRDAAFMDWLPLSDDHNDTVVLLEDQPLAPDAAPPDHPATFVSPSYFSTMGIPILTGRTFEPMDIAHPSTEVLVGRAFAERYWKGQSAIGKRIRTDPNGPWFTIVGVTGDAHMAALDHPAEQLVYLPMVSQEREGAFVPGGVALGVRTAGDPLAVSSALRGVFRSIDPTLPTYDERPMTALLSGAAARTRFVLLMLGVASFVALLMGMVGLYGVLAYGVTLRRREIGVRMALGATIADVTRMIARRGLWLAALGIGAGLVGALVTTRFLRGLLYGVSPTDPVALAGTCVVLLAAAAVASWLPARRAAALDPMEALRRD